MEQALLVGVAGIIVLGIASQWLAERLRLPAILVLLVVGVLAGPVGGVLDPDELIGEVFPALVALSVGLILFDGGLNLRFKEVEEVRGAVNRMVTVGSLITWTVGTLAAHWILGLPWRLSLLLAAILIVSGPTVILPLLRQIRPKGRLRALLKWEGIFIDPLGAVISVLVFEVIIAGGERQAFGLNVLVGLLRTVVVGGGLGLAGAAIVVILLRRFLISAHLEIPFTLMVVLTVFVGSNVLQPESGLLTVTVMGVALANQRITPVRHIVEFGETLGVLLTSTLFIALAARLTMDDLARLDLRIVAFVAVLIVVARPLSVWVSTLGSGMHRRELALVAWMAPRGIVAASVASLFALRLAEAGVEDAELLLPYTFATIVGTVAVYGLTAGPLANRLGLAHPDPRGVIIVGAHGWAREIARVLCEMDVRTVLVPTNRGDLAAARLDGRDVHVGSVLRAASMEEVDFDGIGQVVALTHNEEFNSLAALRFIEVLGREHVYQLPADREQGSDREVTHDLRGRLLFGSDVTFQRLDERFAHGGTVKRTKITEEFSYGDLQEQYEGDVIPLFVVDESSLTVVSVDEISPAPGQSVVSVVPSGDETRDQGSAERSKNALEDDVESKARQEDAREEEDTDAA